MSFCKRLKFLIVLFFPFVIQAQQDVTGLWKGFMYNDTTQQNYRYEIAISEEKGKLIGYSHTYFIVGDKEYHGVKRLKVKRDGDEIITEEVELIVHNYPVPPAKGVHQQNTLILSIKDSVMMLTGGYKTNRTRDFRPVTGYVHVERKNDYSQSALVPHLQELNLAKNLSFLKEESKTTPAETEIVLKPVATDEEVKSIAFTAKAKQPDDIIKTSAAPGIKVPVLPIITEPESKTPITTSAKEVPKPSEPVIAKNTTPKKTVPVVIIPPAVKKQEPVVTTKPTTVKPTDPPVVKNISSPPAIKPTVPKPQPAITDPTAATDLAKRKVETIQALYFKSDSLTLTLYDNGEVDGDTVSVVLNGNVIMPKVGLSTNAVKKTIYTGNVVGDSIQLVMYAESLGSLPPNTGLLIVNDGSDRYEIRFSGDMQKSSAIVFRRKRPL